MWSPEMEDALEGAQLPSAELDVDTKVSLAPKPRNSLSGCRVLRGVGVGLWVLGCGVLVVGCCAQGVALQLELDTKVSFPDRFRATCNQPPQPNIRLWRARLSHRPRGDV